MKHLLNRSLAQLLSHSLKLVSAGMITIVALSANAIERMHAAEQVYTAVMTPSTLAARTMNLPASIILIQTEDASSANTTGFILKINSKSYSFKVLEATIDACHSIRYVAHNIDDRNNEMTLVLIDHQARTCRDLVGQVPGWVAHLEVPTPDRPTVADLSGTPTPVFDITNHLHTLDIRPDLNPL